MNCELFHIQTKSPILNDPKCKLIDILGTYNFHKTSLDLEVKNSKSFFLENLSEKTIIPPTSTL